MRNSLNPLPKLPQAGGGGGATTAVLSRLAVAVGGRGGNAYVGPRQLPQGENIRAWLKPGDGGDAVASVSPLSNAKAVAIPGAGGDFLHVTEYEDGTMRAAHEWPRIGADGEDGDATTFAADNWEWVERTEPGVEPSSVMGGTEPESNYGRDLVWDDF